MLRDQSGERLAAYWAKAAYVPDSTAELNAVDPPLTDAERTAAIHELGYRTQGAAPEREGQ